jgi:hypothetical protein
VYGTGLLNLPFLAAPLFLALTGYGLLTMRIAVPKARAIQFTTVGLLAAKVVVGCYWAVLVLLASYQYGALDSIRLIILTLVVAPSATWAVVLALHVPPRVPEQQ